MSRTISTVAILSLVAACWTGRVDEPATPRRQRAPLKVKPTCWSSAFYEAWPAEIDAQEETAKCVEAWPDSNEMVNACVSSSYWFAYKQLQWWSQKWFDSCDPGRP